MYNYDWFEFMHGRGHHNTVKQLSSHLKKIISSWAMSLFVYPGLVFLFTLSSDSQYSQNLNVHIFLTSWKIFWEFKSSNISSSLLSLSFLPELPSYTYSVQFSSVQSFSHVRLFANPWITACQAFLSITNSWSILKPIHRVGDAIQPSHPLSSPSPPAPNPSQHQGLFQ